MHMKKVKTASLNKARALPGRGQRGRYRKKPGGKVRDYGEDGDLTKRGRAREGRWKK